MKTIYRLSLFVTVLLTLPLFSFARNPPRVPSNEEKFCLQSLTTTAKDEAANSVFEQWPEEDTREIDTSAVDRVKCEVKIKKGTFKIVDRSSEFCPGQAEYSGHCSFPKIGGGYLAKTLSVGGDACCLITEPKAGWKAAVQSAGPRLKTKAPAKGKQ